MEGTEHESTSYKNQRSGTTDTGVTQKAPHIDYIYTKYEPTGGKAIALKTLVDKHDSLEGLIFYRVLERFRSTTSVRRLTTTAVSITANISASEIKQQGLNASPVCVCSIRLKSNSQ